jgi:hypothetical protein
MPFLTGALFLAEALCFTGAFFVAGEVRIGRDFLFITGFRQSEITVVNKEAALRKGAQPCRRSAHQLHYVNLPRRRSFMVGHSRAGASDLFFAI